MPKVKRIQFPTKVSLNHFATFVSQKPEELPPIHHLMHEGCEVTDGQLQKLRDWATAAALPATWLTLEGEEKDNDGEEVIVEAAAQAEQTTNQTTTAVQVASARQSAAQASARDSRIVSQVASLLAGSAQEDRVDLALSRSKPAVPPLELRGVDREDTGRPVGAMSLSAQLRAVQHLQLHENINLEICHFGITDPVSGIVTYKSKDHTVAHVSIRRRYETFTIQLPHEAVNDSPWVLVNIRTCRDRHFDFATSFESQALAPIDPLRPETWEPALMDTGLQRRRLYVALDVFFATRLSGEEVICSATKPTFHQENKKTFEALLLTAIDGMSFSLKNGEHIPAYLRNLVTVQLTALLKLRLYETDNKKVLELLNSSLDKARGEGDDLRRLYDSAVVESRAN